MSLLFYDDSATFGGHEVMTLAGLEGLLDNTAEKVRFVAAQANDKLVARLRELSGQYPQLEVSSVAWHSSKLEGARNLFFRTRIGAASRLLRSLDPDLVIAIQGNIEHSSLILHAARRLNLPSLSYIPVPHSNEEMGARLGGLRDLFCGPLFQLPDAFITITDEMAALLRQRGATAPIHLVYNGIDTRRFHPGDRQEARESLKLPDAKILLGIVGRIEFRQKQQHHLVEAVTSQEKLASSCHLVFAGDGPDRDALRERIANARLEGTILDWCDPAPLYRALDALVIPSRYEGLPLVMLEALASGTPVFGSDRDGMKDILPPEWRFDPDRPGALARVIARWVALDCPPPPGSLMEHVRSHRSLEAFRTSFTESILRIRRDGPTAEVDSSPRLDPLIDSPES